VHITVWLDDGRELVITTRHAASSYGKPVILIDGALADFEYRIEEGE
jgi:hypothetical protein